MNEAKACEIHTAPDLSPYSRDELAEADKWIRDYALLSLQRYTTTGMMPAMRVWVHEMARTTYGSAETDEMLYKCGCYPSWVQHD